MALIVTLLLALTSPGAIAVAPFSVSFLINNLENGGSGKVVIDVHPEWAPNAAERFASLVQQNFFDDMRFFKVITGFSAHFGIPSNPSLSEQWKEKPLSADPEKEGNHRGRVAFFTDDNNPTELVISVKDNDFFDRKGVVPFAEVVEGMFFIDRLMAKHGSKPDASKAEKEGNAYLTSTFPDLSYIDHIGLVDRNPDIVLSMQDETPAVPTTQPVFFIFGMCIGLVAIWYYISKRGSDPNAALKV